MHYLDLRRCKRHPGPAMPNFLPRLCCVLLLSLHAVCACAEDGTADTTSPRLFPVCATVFDTRCGLLDRRGKWAIEPRYGQFFASDGYWVVTTPAGRAGLLDTAGRWLIEPSFRDIGRFRDGLAPASQFADGRYGYIDPKGSWVIPPRFETAGAFSEGVAATSVPAGENSQATYIDPHGRQAVSGTYARAGAFHFGVAQVDRGLNDSYETALIDRTGRLIVPWGHRYDFRPVMRDRIIESGPAPNGLVLRDAAGKVLFTAERSSGEPSEGRMFYSQDGSGMGLLDIASGKPIVQPRPDWRSVYGASTFSDGLAWICTADCTDRRRLALVDRDGRTVLPPALYEQVWPFVNGAALVKYPGKAWQLIDRQGRTVMPPRYEGIVEPAWESSAQTPRIGDIWRITDNESVHDLRNSVWIDTQGRLLARVETLDCGIQAVRDGKGDTIWPRDVEAACAVYRQDHGTSGAAAAPVSPDRIAAVRRAQARDAVDSRQDVMQREAGRTDDGPLAAMLGGPSADLWRDARWQHGPSRVRVGDLASVSVPAGFRYLSPDAVRSLRGPLIKAGWLAANVDLDAMPRALLVPDNAVWAMSVVLARQGHVPVDQARLDPEVLRKTMEARSTNILSQLHESRPTLHHVEWIRTPRWDPAAHRLDWIYNDFALGGSTGNTYYLTSVTLGRRATVGMQVVLGGAGAQSIERAVRDDFDALIKGVSFDAGETYADTTSGDEISKISLDEYVTGPPTPEEIAAPAKFAQAREREFWHTLWARILPLLGLAAIALAATRKRDKRSDGDRSRDS
ncbi:DUF2167 domain-containing protein [Burkholderia multivorans]|uniref:DUF2167 domain-containing protein n=2 Tax=Burkholderia multivorans TaxID=87883 RepID=UPI0021C06FF1|nr:DUF2167 domain-containing protein [Burkholderia multivorans]